MINEIQDERFFVADEAIQDAFFEVFKAKKNLEKITVSDIIKRAGVVRSTFYNHYENIPALVNSIEDKTIHDIFSIMESFHPKNDYEMCKNFYLTICNYTKTNSYLAEVLSSPRGNEFYHKTMTMFHQYVTEVMQKTSADKHSKEEISYAIASSIGATLGILHKWTRENFVIPAETIADFLTETFMKGMFPFMS